MEFTLLEVTAWEATQSMGLPNPADRRSSLLELTPEGRRVFGEAGVAFNQELQRWLGDPVPERTLRQIAGTLARLRAAGRRVEVGESA